MALVAFKNSNAVLFLVLVLTGGGFLLSSCTVGPDYVKPTVDMPPAYKEMQDDVHWRPAQPREADFRGAWWEIFGDPRLNELEQQVAVSNLNIAVAEAQFRQARALVQASRASFFPTVTIGSSYTRSRTPISAGTSTPATRKSETASNYLISGDAAWEPDIWGKVRRSLEGSEANMQASAADLEAVRLSMQAELAQDYLQLRTLDAQKQLYDSTVIAYQKYLDLTKNRYAGGVASRADVLQAETQLKATQSQAVDISLQRAQVEHAIAVLVGKPASVLSIPASPLAAAPPAIPVGVPSVLLERRPDIAAAERRVASANAQIGVAQSAYYPNLTLTASGGFQSASLAKWLSWPNRLWAIGMSLLESVFDGGMRNALTEQARAAYDASVASYRLAVLTGFKEVEDNLAAIRLLEEEARLQDDAVQASRQAVTISTNQYKAGTITYLDVVTVQTIALANERTAVDIQGRRMAASVLLIKALGGGWGGLAAPPSAQSEPSTGIR
ncbi:MAG TPA: efflux transporter outer membrane subunit [Dissulfurispiraceae bacterium]|nr:efflux transporter outer membrane subunit [Dissulfurispiraceae bacterium]